MSDSYGMVWGGGIVSGIVISFITQRKWAVIYFQIHWNTHQTQI